MFHWVIFVFAYLVAFSANVLSASPLTIEDSVLGQAPSRGVTYSSPAVGDIDGNPENGLEIAIGSGDGQVSVFGTLGELLWTAQTPAFSCIGASTLNKLSSSPALGQLYGDGVTYVVVGYGSIGGRSCDGGVAAYNGKTGELAWKFSLKEFAAQQKFWTNMHGVFSTPAIADVDGDGKLEIGFGSFDRNVYLLNFDGSIRWYYQAADTVWSSPAFANVDNDPDLEMILGTDISQNKKIKPATKNGGYLYAFKTKKGTRTKYNFRDKSAYLWQVYFDQVLYSSPTIAELIPDNPGEEIAIGSGCYFPERNTNKKGRWVKIIGLKTGKTLRTLPTVGCSPSSPAVGDLDGDGLLEVVATVSGSKDIGGDGKSRLMAWSPRSGDVVWEVIPQDKGRVDAYGGHFKSPVIGDIDGDGKVEVAISNGGAIGIYSGLDGSPMTCQTSNCSDGLPRLGTGGTLQNTPALVDLNDDGTLEIITAGRDSGGSGAMFAWFVEPDASLPFGRSEFKGLDSMAQSSATRSSCWSQWRGGTGKAGVCR